MNSQKAFLFYDGDLWVKKDTLQHFDVTESSFDGAEVCELVGLYLLNQLRNIITNGSVGVYRDHGLAVVRKYSGPQMDRLRKNNIDFFKDQNLLKNSGFKDKLIYTPCNQRNRRHRNRKIIWCNPSFDLQVKMNIGKTFFQFLDRNFPPHHR